MKYILGLLLLSSLVSCARVDQGEVGIVKSISGGVSNDIRTTGFELVLLDSMEIIDITQNVVSVNDAVVRDFDGITLSEFDANITFDTNPAGVIDFYKKTRSITQVKDQNGEEDNVLGYTIIKLELLNQLQETVAKFKSKDITSNRSKIEQSVRADLQTTLNTRFGTVFSIVDVKINKILLDPSIEKSLQLVQVTRNQQLEVEAQMEQVKMKKDLMAADLGAKAEVAGRYGISMKEYLDYEVRRDFNKAIEKSTGTQLHLTK